MPSDSSSSQNDSLNAALMLVSRQLDEELTQDEASRLAQVETHWPTEIGSFRRQCQLLRVQLQTAPAQKITGLLFTIPPAPVAAFADEVPARRRSGAQRLVVGTVTAILCCGLVVAVFGPSERSADSTMASARSSPAHVEYSPDARHAADVMPSMGTPMVDSLEFSPVAPMSDGPGSPIALKSETSDASLALAAVDQAAAETSTDDIITPLVQSDNWNVVVVKVNSQDRDQAMDRIASIVKEHGLRLQRSAGKDRPEWLGVVLTSADGASEEVVTAMEKGLSESTTRRQIVESRMSPEASSKIIAAVRESLRYPTRSELHHGRIFVALPTAPLMARAIRSSGSSAASQPAATSARNEVVKAEAITEDQSSKPTLAKVTEPEASPIASPTVTLVVFEFPQHQ